MLRIATIFGVLLVPAQLFCRSHAFQNVGTSGVSRTKPTTKQQLFTTTGNDARFVTSNGQISLVLLHESMGGNNQGDETNKDDAAATDEIGVTTAATNTVNERLMNELQEATETEKFGAKGKRRSLVDGYGRRRKSDEEIKVAIAEARDLNGVNPVVAIVGSFFAFGVAGALWIGTNKLGTYFASHPPETEVYFVQRTAQVFRNVVMGMISLASGFFGVTGVGIFSMGVRVAYGVATGELDPTPIKNRSTPAKKSVDVGNMMDLMMNKKQGRRGGGKK